MALKLILLMVFLKILAVENRMLPMTYMTASPPWVTPNEADPSPTPSLHDAIRERVLGLKNYDDSEDYNYEVEGRQGSKSKKPCAIVVLSNMQSPTMQSLLRKYRYDANGILIPSSVQYFIKLPQGLHSSPVLVPLNDKAFSPLGGFVRYYKEVPPIPQSWRR